MAKKTAIKAASTKKTMAAAISFFAAAAHGAFELIMKKTLLIFVWSVCVMSCANAQTLGPGVSVDRQGSLIIDAPLYVLERNTQEPVLKPAPASMNFPVCASIPMGDADYYLEVTGGIVKGRLSITIKKPDEDQLPEVMYFRSFPSDIFADGAEVKIVELSLGAVEEDDCCIPIVLFPNPQVELRDTYEYHTVEGDRCIYIYSLVDVHISRKFSSPQWGDFDFNVGLSRGWNVISTGSYFDTTLNDKVITQTSVFPLANALWVLD